MLPCHFHFLYARESGSFVAKLEKGLEGRSLRRDATEGY